MISAWLIDLDGTLYHPGRVKLGMLIELVLFGLPALRTLHVFRTTHEQLRDELRQTPSTHFRPNPFEEQLKRSAEVLGKSTEQVRAIVNDWMFERPGHRLFEARRSELILQIRDFRRSGGKVALVSDYPAALKLRALRSTDLFDVVVASGEHPGLTRLKPCPDGFLLAARELGIDPAECLVMGDRTDADGAAAQAAGMEFRLVQ